MGNLVMNKSFVWIAAILASCFFPGAMLAQSDSAAKPPAAREVIGKFVTALGGKEMLQKHTSQHATGKFEVLAQGLSGNMEIWSLKPNKLLIRIDIPGFGLIENGFDGETGWSLDPASGPKLLAGKELDQLRYEADFYAPLHEEKNFKSMETVETASFEGRECHKLKCVRLSGEEVYEYFDTHTGLLYATEMNQASPLGTMKVVSIAQEYKSYGGMQIATKSVQKMMGLSQTIQLNSVDFDSVSEEIFALPEKIKTLKNKK
jgi:hypothetical protein